MTDTDAERIRAQAKLKALRRITVEQAQVITWLRELREPA